MLYFAVIFWFFDILECERNTKVLRKKIKAKKNTNIPCCITGHPFPEITWYKDESELIMPNGSLVIGNVRYQQKGAHLLISRTDVHGSGNYQCLARNSAGYERGEIYQVIFYGKILMLHRVGIVKFINLTSNSGEARGLEPRLEGGCVYHFRPAAKGIWQKASLRVIFC